jgi:hypothetical protein
MKMVKSLLLGSAAGLAVAGGVQAADLPVKARPVQYVKICTLYGDGFYYIPGTDTCIKFSGYVRTDYGWNTQGGAGNQYSRTFGAQTRVGQQYSTRHRARFQVDTRTQTGYGTLRTYEALQMQHQNGTFSFGVTRAFIQWAGFTFGRAQSFSDTWGINASWHYVSQENSDETGANGVNQIAYTWEIGNGVSFTIGADDPRSKALADLSDSGALKVGSNPSDSFAGDQWPDPHVSLHVNQAWGYWAASAIAHRVAATYYSGGSGVCPTGIFAQPGTTQCGHPDDEVGFALQTGAEFKLSFINPGDRLGFGVRYGQGASGYAGGNRLASAGLFDSGNQVALGWLTDGVFVDGSSIELTTVWTVAAGYEHYWTPKVKTSITGAYTNVSYNAAATSWLQTQLGCGGVIGTAAVKSDNVSAFGNNSCDPDWQYFQGGIRTQWTPVKGFFLGVDVFYTQIFTGFSGDGAIDDGAPGARPTGGYLFDDFGNLGVVFRAQRNW